MSSKEITYWVALHVTILKAHYVQRHDYFSESDCYVTLNLPTASARMFRTKMVNNSSTPEWNETFTFRLHSHVKNILEMKLWDHDLTYDDLLTTILFDISNLIEGKKETKVFTSESGTELWVEFELLESGECVQEYLTNGILMAAPLSLLDINIDNLNSKKVEDKVLKIRGSFERDLSFEEKRLCFHINRDLETELRVEAPNDQSEDTVAAPLLSAVPIQLQAAKCEVKLSLPLDQDKVDVELQASNSPETHMEVRVEFDIPQPEKDFLEKRKGVVAQALQKILGLSSPTEHQNVPVIALVASGGGTRAMTGLFGSLKGLQQIGLLDAVTYITGVSGSTWTMSSLYQRADWSQQDLDGAIKDMEGEITKSFLACFSQENLHYYKDEMEKKTIDGHLVSLVDMWGLVIENLIFGKKINNTLSDQQMALNQGQNPLPIYTAVNMKDGMRGNTVEAEWCEFTPYEVGLAKYGAFVSAENFGSQFFLGHLIKKLPEIRLPYLIGIWSNAFSISFTSLWEVATGVKPSWDNWMGHNVSDIGTDDKPSTLDTYLLNPVTCVAGKLTSFFKSRPVMAEMYNFMRGFFLHGKYNEHRNFNAWKEGHPDAFPNRLTPADAKLRLVDSGLAINIGCLPVLRPERGVDVIVSLDYSWDPGNVLNVLKKTAAYCTDHKIPFPRIDFAEVEAEPIRELYVFEDADNPEAPVVLHLPLVNITHKEFKAPGVRRETEAELKAGQVDVASADSPYRTKKLTYSSEIYQSLVGLTTYNIVNNKDEILLAIDRALNKKASKASFYSPS